MSKKGTIEELIDDVRALAPKTPSSRWARWCTTSPRQKTRLLWLTGLALLIAGLIILVREVALLTSVPPWNWVWWTNESQSGDGWSLLTREIRDMDTLDWKTHREEIARNVILTVRYPPTWLIRGIVSTDRGFDDIVLSPPEAVKRPRPAGHTPIIMYIFSAKAGPNFEQRWDNTVAFLRAHASEEARMAVDGREALKFEGTRNPFVLDLPFRMQAVLIKVDTITSQRQFSDNSVEISPKDVTYQAGFLFVRYLSDPSWEARQRDIFDEIISSFEINAGE